MTLRSFFLFSVVIFAAQAAHLSAQAQSADSPYRSGFQICTSSPNPVAKEHGFWVRSGEALIYAWTRVPFSPQKKTMIFIAGGPGDQSHESSMNLPDWNVVFFDQRGISCSRPETEKLYHSKTFYSSRKTVLDIEAIRQHLKVDQISLYGVSYGTVPAHLYAATFPKSTRALVLEGVVAQSDATTLVENPDRREILQNYFDSLPRRTQDRILELSARADLSPAWFSQVGKMMLYLDDPLTAFGHFLDSVLWQDSALQTLLPGFADKLAPETEFGFGSMTMRMLSCQEMGVNSPATSFVSRFEGRKLVAIRNNDLRKLFCAPLGFLEHEESWIFKSIDNPLKVPVTYIQGELDGATSARQALQSFEKAAQGPAQLILVSRGGHQPLQGPLASGLEPGPRTDLRTQLLGTALDGKEPPAALLKALNEVTGLSWNLQKKNRTWL